MAFNFLKNFRRGFATNSSSSHSFVYMKEPTPDAHDDVYLSEEEFGWQDFRLSSIKEKLFYVLVNRIGGGWEVSEEESDKNFENYSERFPELTREDFREAERSYVDHGSRHLISEEQARDPRIVIFGGNDNSPGSQERAAAFRDSLVDTKLTELIEEDEEYIPEDDLEAQKDLKMFHEKRGW